MKISMLGNIYTNIVLILRCGLKQSCGRGGQGTESNDIVRVIVSVSVGSNRVVGGVVTAANQPAESAGYCQPTATA